MKHFWNGFQKGKGSAPIRFKKHVIVLFWSPGTERSAYLQKRFKKMSHKYPTVAVKVINVRKDPTIPEKHKVLSLPTVLLLKDGREVDRIDLDNEMSLLDILFRKAQV